MSLKKTLTEISQSAIENQYFVVAWEQDGQLVLRRYKDVKPALKQFDSLRHSRIICTPSGTPAEYVEC